MSDDVDMGVVDEQKLLMVLEHWDCISKDSREFNDRCVPSGFWDMYIRCDDHYNK
jgi:hypothetical protein